MEPTFHDFFHSTLEEMVRKRKRLCNVMITRQFVMFLMKCVSKNGGGIHLPFFSPILCTCLFYIFKFFVTFFFTALRFPSLTLPVFFPSNLSPSNICRRSNNRKKHSRLLRNVLLTQEAFSLPLWTAGRKWDSHFDGWHDLTLHVLFSPFVSYLVTIISPLEIAIT